MGRWRLKAVVLTGPDLAVDGVVGWRIVDLCRWVEERWGVRYSETGMLRLLWSLDLSHRKSRPRYPQTERMRPVSLSSQFQASQQLLTIR